MAYVVCQMKMDNWNLKGYFLLQHTKSHNPMGKLSTHGVENIFEDDQ